MCNKSKSLYRAMASPVNYEFVDKVREDNIWTICTNILIEPVRVICCGQLFCKECLNKWLEEQKQKTCPNCRKENFNSLKVRMKKIIDSSIIDSSKIYCLNCCKGCDKISTVGECSTHLETCLFVEVPCTNNCGAKVTRKELQNHTANECPKRKVNCQYCKEEGMYKDITAKDHIDKCPSLPLDCPNNCGHGKIQRKDLSDHRKECPLEPKCPFFEAGCKQVTPRKELAAHKASNKETHLELMMINTQRQLETMTQTDRATQEKLETITHTARATQEKLETMTQTARATQEKLEATQVELKQLTLKFDGLATYVSSKVAASSNIKLALEAMTTMLKQGKQYCLLLVKCDEHTTRSPSFYIHPGYKMYLAIKRKDKETTIYTIYLERGEDDDKLKWPIPGMDIEVASADKKDEMICTIGADTETRLRGDTSKRVIGKTTITKDSPWSFPRCLLYLMLITVKIHSIT